MYKKRTRFFRIPYISEGEDLTEEDECIAATILDNQLMVATCGLNKVLIDDGDYDIYDNGDDTYTLGISRSGSYSVVGMLNSRLFFCEEDLHFVNLQKGKYYFLYASYNDDMNLDPTKFTRLITTDSKAESPYNLLLAIVDLRGEKPVINDNPGGKVYTKNILAHSNDYTNPHGRLLHQDNLYVDDNLFICGKEVYETEYRDIISAGNNNFIELSFDKKVMFATVMPMGINLGNYWFEIENKKLRFYNSGVAVKCKLEIKLNDELN